MTIDTSGLHVITMISNPMRFQSRYQLYESFARHMAECGVNFWTCEVSYGDRPFAVTSASNPRHLQLRTSVELWHKENALNLLTERVPGWKYLAWVDADIEFTTWRGPNAWWHETVQQLQHHKVVQLFQNAIDLGPHGEVIQHHNGFAWSYRMGKPSGPHYTHWHPGFAWAIRREAFDGMGGLLDWAPLGAGDNHMAHAWIGRGKEGVNPLVHKSYLDRIMLFQEQTERYVRRDIGFVKGTVLHHWHGKKKDRKYWDRWKILTELKFDPYRDLKRDAQGLYLLCDHGDQRSIELRDRIREYFRSRNEDSIDTE